MRSEFNLLKSSIKFEDDFHVQSDPEEHQQLEYPPCPSLFLVVNTNSSTFVESDFALLRNKIFSLRTQ